MKSITNRQLCLLICVSIVSLKFLFFPAIVCLYARNNSYISVLLGLIIDFAIVVIIAYCLKRFKGLSFKEILISNLGKAVYYVIYSLLFVYLMFKALLAIKEIHHYFLEFLYEGFSWVWFAIPICLLVGYVAAKNLRAVARTVEILFVLIAFGVIITVLIPAKDVNFSYLLPIFEYPQGVLEGVFRTTFVYADWIIILVTMGDVKMQKGSIKRLLLTMGVVYLFVVAFMVVYVGLFKNVGIYKPYAFSDISLYADLPNNSARIDWFSSIIWTFALLLQVCIMVSLASHTLRQLIPKINNQLCGVVCIVVIMMGMLVFYLNLAKLIDLITSKWFCAVTFGFHLLLPLLLCICVAVDAIRNKLKNASEYGNVKKVAQK